jgi:TolB-like protein
MKKVFLALLAFAFSTAFAQSALPSVAVLPSEDTGASLGNDEIEALTDKMREAALKVLPPELFVLMTQDQVMRRLGGAENYIKECSESSCIVDLGKKAQVDYVAQASMGKLGDKIRLKVELYNVSTSGLIGVFTDEAEDIRGLLAIVENRAPEVFGRLLGQSGQSVALEGNFGILAIEPVYSDGIGKNENWNLTINGIASLFGENQLPPNRYNVKLSHRCYEDISLNEFVGKDERKVIDMASHVKLKKGGLILNAEQDGVPVNEPVYVNGERAGQTPFSTSVPVCTEIRVGKKMEKVNVELKHNENVVHTVKSSKTMRVGIDIRNQKWSGNVLAVLSRYNRYDVSDRGLYEGDKLDFDFAKQYDYAILGTNYNEQWVPCQSANCEGHYLQTMNITLTEGAKTSSRYIASCQRGRSMQSCDPSQSVLQQFLGTATVEASVTSIENGEIIINRGSNSDIRKNHEFVVLGEDKEVIGKIRVKKVREETSVAEKIRGKVYVNSHIKETRSFNPSSVYLSFSPGFVDSRNKEDRKFERSRLTGLAGYERINNESKLGAGAFVGGGALGDDIGEFIAGGDLKKLFWLLDERIVFPVSVGFAYRRQWGEIENSVVAEFIDEPKFQTESVDYLNEKRGMYRNNFDIMPAADLQIFISDNFSIYAGYMYRLSFSGDWFITYKIPGESYSDGKSGSDYDVPDEYNTLRKPKEHIFGIPGVVRAGLKFHVN